jgi:hypothetical protein
MNKNNRKIRMIPVLVWVSLKRGKITIRKAIDDFKKFRKVIYQN